MATMEELTQRRAKAVRRCRLALDAWMALYDDVPEMVPGDGWPTLRARRELPAVALRCRRALRAVADHADLTGVDSDTTVPLRQLAVCMTDFWDWTRPDEYPPGASRPEFSPWRPRAFSPMTVDLVSEVLPLVDRISAILACRDRPTKAQITLEELVHVLKAKAQPEDTFDMKQKDVAARLSTKAPQLSRWLRDDPGRRPKTPQWWPSERDPEELAYYLERRPKLNGLFCRRRIEELASIKEEWDRARDPVITPEQFERAKTEEDQQRKRRWDREAQSGN